MKKSQIVLDFIDLKIYEIIKKNKGILIGGVKDQLDITHASLTPHLNRLKNLGLIEVEPEQQKKHLFVKPEHSDFWKVLKVLQENRSKLKVKK